jgi:hypothetical protein
MDLVVTLSTKAQVLFWLMIQSRLNTKDLMERNNFFVQSKECVLYDESVYETMLHHFFACDFSQNFWWEVREEWNIDLPLIDMLNKKKNRSPNPFFIISMIVGC